MKNLISIFTFLFIIFSIFNPLYCQIQVGNDINGEAAGDNSGRSVSISSDGNRIAIGAPFNGGNGDMAGHVRIYEWDNGSWTKVGEDIDGEEAGDKSGICVSLSSDGNRVAIGAAENKAGIPSTTTPTGHVRIFEWNDGSWTQIGEDIDGAHIGDWFGSSVSISSDGNRVASGATEASGDFSGNAYAGHVRVFDWDGEIWVQVGEDINGEGEHDRSGFSVSLSSNGNRVAIGAPGNVSDPFGSSPSGHVRVYSWSGDGWMQVGEDIDGDYAYDRKGESVSLSSDGNRLAIGSIGVAGSAGQAQIYEWNGANWAQMGEDINGQMQTNRLGRSVSLSSNGSRVAIGADDYNNQTGHTRIYDWNGGSWTQINEFIDGENLGDNSGLSVSLSSAGDKVVIGAPWNDGNGESSGHVRVYELAPVSTITPKLNTTIEIFPNPASKKIELIGVKNGMIKIIDNFGKIVWRSENPTSEISISNFAPGTYFIYIYSDNQLITKKFIKL